MKVLVAAIISEGILLVLSLIGQQVFALKLSWPLDIRSLLLGGLLTVPPLIANHLLWEYSERTPSSVYSRFSREVIIPLCSYVNTTIAFVVATLSGICEEWFFRGTLAAVLEDHAGSLVSCFATSFLFAAVHFIGSFKRYGAMIPLYTGMGIYLWCVQRILGSLTSVALLHGLYNFTVICMVRRRLIAPAKA